MIRIKRIYEKYSKEDGYRILVDRLWPRGMTKEKAKVDLWFKEVAPSDRLRKDFCHVEEKWEEFRRKYEEELKSKENLILKVKDLEKQGAVTLLFATKDKKTNNAVVLKEFLDRFSTNLI